MKDGTVSSAAASMLFVAVTLCDGNHPPLLPCRSPSACDRLVDAGALAQLFAVFMGRSKIKNSKGTKSDKDVAKEVEERCVSIISNLFQVGLSSSQCCRSCSVYD